MREAVDTGIDEIDRIVVIEDVRDHGNAAHVCFIDDHAIERRRQFGRAAVAIVHPDLDAVDFAGGEIQDRLARLALGRDFVRDAGVGRAAGARVRRADAAAGHQQARGVQLALLLLGAQVVQQVAALDAL